MSAAVLDALRNAVSALVTAAPEPIVKRMLRELLAEEARPNGEATARGNGVLPAQRSTEPLASPPRPARKHVAGRAAANVRHDPAWEELRLRVRQAMRERGTSYAALGAAIGRAPATLKVDVSRHRAASQPLQAKLRAWLEAAEQASEVAAPALPFRAARGNGAAATQRGDSAAATRVHASAGAVASPHG